MAAVEDRGARRCAVARRREVRSGSTSRSPSPTRTRASTWSTSSRTRSTRCGSKSRSSPRSIRESRIDADNDRALANALERSKAEIVLGYFFHMSEAEVGHKLDPSAHRTPAARNRRFQVSTGHVHGPASAREAPFLKAYAPQGNLDMFTAVVQSSGFFSVASDPDGVVRWMPLVIQAGEDSFPPLPLLLYWHYLGKPPLVVRVGAGGVEGVEHRRTLHPDR